MIPELFRVNPTFVGQVASEKDRFYYFGPRDPSEVQAITVTGDKNKTCIVIEIRKFRGNECART